MNWKELFYDAETRDEEGDLAHRPMGLAFSEGHFMWGWGHGALLHWPHWFKNIIVKVWNFSACRLTGHKMLFGPLWSQSGELIHPKICCACSKRFPSIPGEGFIESDDDEDYEDDDE